MSVAPTSSCFVALPSATEDAHTIFGKNSARPSNEVQEVIYIPPNSHEPGSKVQVRNHFFSFTVEYFLIHFSSNVRFHVLYT